MRKNFFSLAGIKIFRLFPLIFFFAVQIYPQAKSNLELFYQLIDSSSSLVSNKIDTNEINAELTFSGNFSVFKNQFVMGMEKRGKKISSFSDSAAVLNYVLENADIKYGEMFRSSFLGDYLIEREARIEGNFSVRNLSEADNHSYKNYPFNIYYMDTIKVEDINTLENPQFPFTQDEVPPEPFFSSIWIPIVAVTTAAAAIYLFFSIRSK